MIKFFSEFFSSVFFLVKVAIIVLGLAALTILICKILQIRDKRRGIKSKHSDSRDKLIKKATGVLKIDKEKEEPKQVHKIDNSELDNFKLKNSGGDDNV